MMTAATFLGLSSVEFEIPYSYAAYRTFSIETELDDDSGEAGDTQTISFVVKDEDTDVPVDGAITRATVHFADGETVKQLATITDASGKSSLPLKIDEDTDEGTFNVYLSVGGAGYESEPFSKTFEVNN